MTTVTKHGQPEVSWDQVSQHLRAIPGVEEVALAGWPLLSGWGWNDSISINGGLPSDDLTYFLNVSPGWTTLLKIPLIHGRDFRLNDTYPGSAIVNETFVKRYFPGGNPFGRWFDQRKMKANAFTFRL